MKKSKVFIGPVDVANNSITFSKALRINNIRTDYWCFKNRINKQNFTIEKVIFQFIKLPNVFGKNITQLVNMFIAFNYLIFFLLKYNTFIFNSPNSLLKKNRDLWLLKLCKKKVIFIFPGCVERDVEYSLNNKEYICNRCDDLVKQQFCNCNNIERKRARIRKMERFSNYIIAQDDCAGYLIHKNNFNWFYVISELPRKKDYLTKFNEDKIKIVHFPSNPKIKLSHIIIPVLEKIAKENKNIEIVIKTGITHDEVLEELDSAHILVDALGLSYGSLAIEAMSMGCAVVVGEMDYIDKQLPEHPLICATSETLYEKLVKAINDKEFLVQKAKESIEFYYKYHSPESAGKYYKEILELH